MNDKRRQDQGSFATGIEEVLTRMFGPGAAKAFSTAGACPGCEDCDCDDGFADISVSIKTSRICEVPGIGAVPILPLTRKGVINVLPPVDQFGKAQRDSAQKALVEFAEALNSTDKFNDVCLRIRNVGGAALSKEPQAMSTLQETLDDIHNRLEKAKNGTSKTVEPDLATSLLELCSNAKNTVTALQDAENVEALGFDFEFTVLGEKQAMERVMKDVAPLVELTRFAIVRKAADAAGISIRTEGDTMYILDDENNPVAAVPYPKNINWEAFDALISKQED